MASSTRYYETAQICTNGHLITKHFDLHPMDRCNSCPTCGASAISECPHCHEKIRGCYHVKRLVRTTNMGNDLRTSNHCITDTPYSPPAYCHSCGKPFPWMEAKLEEVSLLISMSEELSTEEQKTLNKLFPDLFVDRPHTVSSAISVAHILKKASPFLHDALKSAIGDKIVSTALKFLDW